MDLTVYAGLGKKRKKVNYSYIRVSLPLQWLRHVTLVKAGLPTPPDRLDLTNITCSKIK